MRLIPWMPLTAMAINLWKVAGRPSNQMASSYTESVLPGCETIFAFSLGLTGTSRNLGAFYSGKILRISQRVNCLWYNTQGETFTHGNFIKCSKIYNSPFLFTGCVFLRDDQNRRIPRTSARLYNPTLQYLVYFSSDFLPMYLRNPVWFRIYPVCSVYGRSRYIVLCGGGKC